MPLDGPFDDREPDAGAIVPVVGAEPLPFPQEAGAARPIGFGAASPAETRRRPTACSGAVVRRTEPMLSFDEVRGLWGLEPRREG